MILNILFKIKMIKFIYKISLLLITLTFITSTLKAEIIEEINIEGNQRISEETIKMFAGVNITDDISQVDLNKILKRLYDTNFFDLVSVKISNKILIVTVKENPIIQNINFNGIKSSKILDDLKKNTELKSRSSFNEILLEKDKKEIRNFLKNIGYYFSKIEILIEELEDNKIDLTYVIDLGEKAKIRKISFIGDKIFKDKKLKGVILSEEYKAWKFLSGKKYLNESMINYDERLLKNFYLNKGYYNVVINSSFAKMTNDQEFELIFNIDANPKLFFGSLKIDLPSDFSKSNYDEVVKFFKKIENEPYSVNRIEDIIENIGSYDLSSRIIGKAKRIDDAQARYIEFVKGTLERDVNFDGIKVVIDSANGAAYKVAPLALWELGAKVVSIGDRPNGININHEYGSTSLSNLKKAVHNNKADIGIALDGDADRIIVIDEMGEIIDGDALLAIIATEWKRLGKLKKDSVVATILSNIGLDDYLSREEMKLYRTNVGDRYVSQFMRENGCNIGGEQSGHIIIGDYSTTGDGLLAAIQILSIMKKSNKKISELAQLIEIVPQIQRNYRVRDYEKINTKEIDEIHKIGQERIKEKGRVLVRLSGTEPLIRVMGESKDKKYLNQTLDYLMDLIEERFN